MAGAAARLIYGTCVALGPHAALLRGASGSGKSDLALRFVLETPDRFAARLVADDQALVERLDDRLIVRPPATIAGKIEVRGIGIVTLPHRPEAELRLLIDLADSDDVPRLPTMGKQTETISGVSLPVLQLSPFEASAPLKLRLALELAVRL